MDSGTIVASIPTPRHAAGAKTMLARKLSLREPLQHAERDALDKALSLDVRQVQRRTVLLDAGAASTKVAVMLSGWAIRCKRLDSRRAQVVAFYLPGDVCDFGLLVAETNDSTIELMSGACVAGLSREAFATLNQAYPRITQGLWWDAQVAAAVQREWMLNVGLRDARTRVAHLICELASRVANVGLLEGARFALPITQGDFASACAMTTAHTNRTLRQLREEGLVVWHNGSLLVEDWGALAALAGFDPYYLRLEPSRAAIAKRDEPPPDAAHTIQRHRGMDRG